MSLINCPECNNQISDKAIHCPNCGFPISTQTIERKTLDDNLNQSSEQIRQKKNEVCKNPKLLLITLVVVIAVGIFGTLFGIFRHKANVLAEQEAALQQRIKEEEMARQKAIEDSIARVTFQTPDLKMVGAHGPVKSIEYYNDQKDPVLHVYYASFAEDGFINKVAYDKNEEFSIKRNAKGLIEELKSPDRHTRFLYTYSGDDFVKTIGVNISDNHTNALSLNSTPTWDETGKMSKEISIGTCDNGLIDVNFSVTYKYLKNDKYDNWTEVEVRFVKVLYCAAINQRSEDTNFYAITRKIEYYE